MSAEIFARECPVPIADWSTGECSLCKFDESTKKRRPATLPPGHSVSFSPSRPVCSFRPLPSKMSDFVRLFSLDENIPPILLSIRTLISHVIIDRHCQFLKPEEDEVRTIFLITNLATLAAFVAKDGVYTLRTNRRNVPIMLIKCHLPFVIGLEIDKDLRAQLCYSVEMAVDLITRQVLSIYPSRCLDMNCKCSVFE